MSLYGAAIGVLAACGVWLVIAGWRGQPVRDDKPSRLDVDVSRYGRPALLAVVVFAVVWAVTGWPAAGISLAGVAVMVPMFLDAHRRRDAAIRRTEALASWAEMLRDTISAQAGLHQAIGASAEVAPTPIRAEVRRLAIRSGQMPLGRALRLFAADVADPVADLIVSAMVIADEQRAQRLPELLGEVANSTRAQAAMRLRVETTRARTYASARALVVITLVMVVALMVLSPKFMEPYDTLGGQVVLLVIGGLFIGAVASLIQMSRPIPVPRQLAGIEESDGVTQQQEATR